MPRSPLSLLALLLVGGMAMLTPSHALANGDAHVGGRGLYGVGYNFQVVVDTLALQEDMPMHLLIAPERGETLYVRRGQQVVVADVEVIPEDSVDSVWVKVASDQLTQGWTHERSLLHSAIPDEPVSHCIFFLTRSHLPLVVALVLLFLVVWAGIQLSHRERRLIPLVHIRDIPSPYPLLLCLATASTALLYAALRRGSPEVWAFFYFHPTLWPLGQPLLLTLFLTMAWLGGLLLVATMIEIGRLLPPPEVVPYGLSLLAVMAILVEVFARIPPLPVGLPLLVLYGFLSLGGYVHRSRPLYVCPRCGARLRKLGPCPRCGALNT